MIFIILLASFTAFSIKRLFTYLHIFQQEEYDNLRFLNWVVKKRAFDRKLTLLILGLVLFSLLIGLSASLTAFLTSLLFLAFAFKESDPRRHAKKKLVLTQRAMRIFVFALIFALIEGWLCVLISSSPWIWIVPVQSLPLLLVIVNELLSPIEKLIQRKYWNEAYAKVMQHRPFIIGITGSFGKTSIKHILGHILETTCPTLITPGSVNTPMGITRIIRDFLKPQHKYLVVEMGAYGPGSIARLCELTPPNMAVITAVGYAHFERFKSLEAVAKTKFELADAVCKVGGKIVTHSEVLSFPYTRTFADMHKDNFIVCGNSEAVCNIQNIQQRRNGLTVDIIWRGNRYILEAPLYGKHHGRNVAFAFAAACLLGIPPELVITALKSTPQIPHRLQVQEQADGTILIDDAFNSNPEGFVAALELLDVIQQSNGRRILVTPGIVELGSIHDIEHAKLGSKAAQHADIVLAVAPEQIKPFIEAFRANMNPNQELITCPTFDSARSWLAQNTRDRDVILLENDLPDLYESSLKL